MSLPARMQRNLPKPVRKKREGNSQAHLEMIRQLACVVCLRPPRNDPHHLQQAAPEGQRGVALKASDRWSLPICRPHHSWAESKGDDEAQFASIGIDARALCCALWFATGELKMMERIVFRFHQASRLYIAQQTQERT